MAIKGIIKSPYFQNAFIGACAGATSGLGLARAASGLDLIQTVANMHIISTNHITEETERTYIGENGEIFGTETFSREYTEIPLDGYVDSAILGAIAGGTIGLIATFASNRFGLSPYFDKGKKLADAIGSKLYGLGSTIMNKVLEHEKLITIATLATGLYLGYSIINNKLNEQEITMEVEFTALADNVTQVIKKINNSTIGMGFVINNDFDNPIVMNPEYIVNNF